MKTSASGQPVAIVSTDGQYSYVGRLTLDFDDNGVMQKSSMEPAKCGPMPAQTRLWRAVGFA
jgi:2',3'-cyclic-nucleotide 2'-phosphodiesterase (5'-nucleotidase family)